MQITITITIEICIARLTIVNSGAEQDYITTIECGPMPNVMATLPNIGGTLCSTPQSLADAHY